MGAGRELFWDNNDFALALNMTVPMFFFMAQVESRKWIRLTIRVLLACVVISIIGTYSCGWIAGTGGGNTGHYS